VAPPTCGAAPVPEPVLGGLVAGGVAGVVGVVAAGGVAGAAVVGVV
jgi:hypothetical protein